MSVGAFVRMAARSGEDFIYTEFSQGARDAYEDVVYTASDDLPTVRGIRSDGSKRMFRTANGEERGVDIAVLVASPLKDSLGNPVIIDSDMKERAPTLTDVFGRIYKIVGVGYEGASKMGTRRLLCVNQAGPTTDQDQGAFDTGFDTGFDI